MFSQFLLSRSGSGNVAPPTYADEPPQDGLIADWRFSEGSGTTVADETGTYPISLTAANTPNTSWDTFGIAAPLGAVQTPSITGMRTVVVVYRTNVDSGGLIVSGPIAFDDGPRNSSFDQSTKGPLWVGQGWGIHPVSGRDVLDTGPGAYGMNNGGWHVLIHELPSTTTSILTFGSRSYAYAVRHTQFDIAHACVYDRVLTEQDRATLYSFARGLCTGRGQYLDFRDCPVSADAIMLKGQSNAAGTRPITSLTVSDQSRTYTATKIMQNPMSNVRKVFSDMVLGATVHGSTSNFGPEVTIANLREDTAGAKDLWIFKNALGGVGIAPLAVSGDSLTFSTDEAENTDGFWSGVLENMYYGIANALEAGVGLDLRGLVWFGGESDTINTARSAVYQPQTEQLFDALHKYLGIDSFPIILARIYDSAPADATAYAQVRAAQAAIAAARSNVTLLDTDGLARSDAVHLSATGLYDFADDVVAELWA